MAGMAYKDKIGQRRADVLKSLRNGIRLKHTLAADDEINRVLPLVEQEFDQRVLAGDLPTVAEMKALADVE